jgi:hypothetical protein
MKTNGAPKLSNCNEELDVVPQEHGSLKLGLLWRITVVAHENVPADCPRQLGHGDNSARRQLRQVKGQSSHFFELIPPPGTIDRLHVVTGAFCRLDVCQKSRQEGILHIE